MYKRLCDAGSVLCISWAVFDNRYWLVFAQLHYSCGIIQYFQLTQNTAAWLIIKIGCFDHTLVIVCRLPVPEQMLLRIADLTYQLLNDSAPSYLSSYVTDVPSRQTITLDSSNRLTVPTLCLTIVSKGVFPVSDVIWNSLSSDITSAVCTVTVGLSSCSVSHAQTDSLI